MDFTCAGSRRKRKNAVDIYADHEKPETGPRGRGRPSKGGQALRSKRYYVKNHMLVLQKRKLKRYMDKVKKIAAEANYTASTIMTQLASKCVEYTKRYHPDIKMNRLLYTLNLARDDRHLEFLNEEGLKYLGEFSDEQIGLEEEVQELQKGLATSHSVLQYLLCTLFSAYLLVRHVQAVHSKIDDTDARDELVKRDCIAYYEISYDHIQPSKDEEEDQYVDRILTDQENKEEKSTVDEDQKPERVEEPKSTSTKTDTVKKVRKEVKRKRKLKAPALNEADSSSKKQK